MIHDWIKMINNIRIEEKELKNAYQFTTFSLVIFNAIVILVSELFINGCFNVVDDEWNFINVKWMCY